MVPSLELFVAAMGVGLAIAMPLGPVATLCIATTLRLGTRAGLVAGVGAAAGDAIFVAIALVGAAQLGDVFDGYHALIRVIAGVVLAIVSLVRWRAGSHATDTRPVAHYRVVLGPMLLTLSNPAALLAAAAMWSAAGWGDDACATNLLKVAVGAFVGSVAWWGLLVKVTGRVGAGRSAHALDRFDRFLTIVLAVFAGLLVLSGVASAISVRL